jgi:hypothetical protein
VEKFLVLGVGIEFGGGIMAVHVVLLEDAPDGGDTAANQMALA